jgi:hypothetical protein
LVEEASEQRRVPAEADAATSARCGNAGNKPTLPSRSALRRKL